MLASEIVGRLEKIAPLSLAFEDDPVGLVFGDPNKVVKKVGVAWAITDYVMEQANLLEVRQEIKPRKISPLHARFALRKKTPEEVEADIDMFILHEYPFFEEKRAIFPGISFFEKPPNAKRIKRLAAKDVCVYVMHSNLDDAEGGTADALAKVLGMHVVEKFKCGRIGEIAETTLGNIVSTLKTSYLCDVIRITGDVESSKPITKVGCFIGPGLKYIDVIEEMYLKGAQVVVSSEMTETVARYADDLGISLIDIERSRLERLIMQNLAEKLERDLKGITVMHYECEDSISYV